MKGIHPEFLLNKKSDNISRVCNLMAISSDKKYSCRDPEEISNIVSKMKLSKRDKKLLREELKFAEESKKVNIGNPSGNIVTGFALKIRTFSDIYHVTRVNNLSVYSVSKKFFESVSSLRREIPIKYINTIETTYFIKIPKFEIYGEEFDGVYLMTYNSTSNFLTLIFTRSGNYSIMGSKFVILGSISNGLIDMDKLDSIEELNPELMDDNLNTLQVSDLIFMDHGNDEEQQKYRTILTGILNTAIYINSQDPEIDELKPRKFYDSKQVSKMDKSVRDNICNLPVKLVNWNYHTGKTFHKDEAHVSSHMRWQPCGPGRSQVKLIWVKEHTRKYNKKSFED